VLTKGPFTLGARCFFRLEKHGRAPIVGSTVLFGRPNICSTVLVLLEARHQYHRYCGAICKRIGFYCL